MGRVLSKRFFGNTNPGGIASGDVVSVTVGGTNNAYTTPVPTITFAPPTIPGGVTAVAGAITLKASVGTLVGAGTGDVSADYTPGDVLTVVGAGVPATLSVASTTIRTAATDTAGSAYSVGDYFTFSGAGWDTPARITVATPSPGPGAIVSIIVTTPGVYSGAHFADPVIPTGLFFANAVAHTDTTATFNLGMGINAVTLTTGGTYTTTPGAAAATTTNSTTGGTGATVTLSAFGLNAIPIVTAGSGYAVAPVVNDSQGPKATLTAVLGEAGEPAIVVHAYTGSSLKIADVVKQTGSHRYRVTTSDGSADGYLKATAATVLGEVNIMAYDTQGCSYFITKLTRHHAVLTQGVTAGTGFVWATGDDVNWWLAAADATHARIEFA